MLVVDREHDPVAEVIDKGPARGNAGQPGGLDGVVPMAKATEVAGKGGPSAGAYPMCHSPVAAAVIPRLDR